MRNLSLTVAGLWAGVCCLAGCDAQALSKTPEAEPTLPQAQQAAAADSPLARAVQAGMKALIAHELDAWLAASRALQAAAPEPSDRGWDPKADADAITAMKRHWHEGRTAYELVEGAIAPVFPESDTATDARYDDFLAVLGGTGDHTPFDREGIVGMHAIERILWADAIPPEVIRFEKGVPGYKPAAQPASAEEAAHFKHGLAQRLVDDVQQLQTQFASVELDVAFAFRGLIDLAVEQAEKVDLAATGQEESRYAQSTMRDLRANQQGCLAAYRVFQPWLLETTAGAAVDRDVLAAFERLRLAYVAVEGDAIPRPPATWSSIAPTATDGASEFGRLHAAVTAETDPERDGSLHHSLVRVAGALGLPKRVTQ